MSSQESTCTPYIQTLNIVKMVDRPWAILMQIEYICNFEKVAETDF